MTGFTRDPLFVELVQRRPSPGYRTETPPGDAQPLSSEELGYRETLSRVYLLRALRRFSPSEVYKA